MHRAAVYIHLEVYLGGIYTRAGRHQTTQLGYSWV